MKGTSSESVNTKRVGYYNLQTLNLHLQCTTEKLVDISRLGGLSEWIKCVQVSGLPISFNCMQRQAWELRPRSETRFGNTISFFSLSFPAPCIRYLNHNPSPLPLCTLTHTTVPAVQGSESRKETPSSANWNPDNYNLPRWAWFVH